MDLRCEHFDYNNNLEQQRALFKDAFPEHEDSSTAKYYWLLHQYPNTSSQSFEYCSYIDEEMVGYYAAIPYRYQIGNVMTDVGMVCGVMTSSSHRGKGIFTQLGRYATGKLTEKVPFTTGYPIRKSVIPGHLKVGWKIAFELPLYMKFIKPDSLLKGKLKWAKPLLPVFSFFLSCFNFILRSKVINGYIAETHTNISDIKGYDEFINKWIKTIPNTLVKNTSFAEWRYGCPTKSYRFLVIKKREYVVGFAAYCSDIKEGVPSYCLLDLTVLPDYTDCLGLIYSTLTKEAKKNNIEAIMFMMSKHSAKQYKVKRNAFLKSPYSFYLIIKNLTNQFSDNELFKEENWHLMWVDSDDL